MKGQVYKIHSDFYYVKTADGLIEAKLKDVLKKQAVSVFVGDFVDIDPEQDKKQGFITKLHPRKNFIPKPKAANIEQVVIVSAVKEPDLNFEQLNRYIAFCEYYKLDVLLCFNKNDLNESSELLKTVKKIYENLGYKTIFISALKQTGISELQKLLTNKVSVFCGLSGVGKTTILNVLHPDLIFRTGKVNLKNGRGTHTTRHCELLDIRSENDNYLKIIDTPGFSNLKFDFLQPAEISELFPEIKQLKATCKYSDCLHKNETGCNVVANLAQIHQTRYDSYLKFVEEANEYKKIISSRSIKTETRAKKINNEIKTKISSKKREETRRKLKQNLENIKGTQSD